MMPRILILSIVLITLALPLCVWAQETPQAEVFAGYSYLRVSPPNTPGVNMHGVDFSVAGNLNSWFGIVADIGYTRSTNFTPTIDEVNYLFGPRISYRKNEKVTPFIQSLFGGAYAGPKGMKSNDFAMTVGGGVDVNVHKNIAIRVAQAEYMLIRDSGQTLNNFRFAAGVVFRTGGK